MPTYAYVAFSCSVPGGALDVQTLIGDLVQPMGTQLRAADATPVSTIHDGGEQDFLGQVVVRCAGRWTLNVRPAATAPVLYDAGTSRGSQAYVYTGAAATRQLSGSADRDVSWAVTATWWREQDPRTVLAADSASFRGAVAGAVPAGPTFLRLWTDDMRWSTA